MEVFNLETYLSNGIDKIVKDILRTSVKSPGAAVFMMQYARENKKAGEIRLKWSRKGRHIPPFLIASITDKCNLHCKGCYARASNSCTDMGDECDSMLLSTGQWADIFYQSSELGVSFILLAGGEPFVRRDVLQAAGRQKDILFPVFTNGTMIDDRDIKMLSKYRNLIPVLSIEGNEETTDKRRGIGIFKKLQSVMRNLYSRGILFGVSVTVHKENMKEAMSGEFLEYLKAIGCKTVIYVEYVPIDKNTKVLALDDESRHIMEEKLIHIRAEWEDMVFLSFPGDEKNSGGCLAAGRGFFHINAHGGAEPCPFSPYSDTSLKEVSLKEALNSPLFKKLKQNGSLFSEHTGGCVLFEQEETVKKLAGGESA